MDLSSPHLDMPAVQILDAISAHMPTIQRIYAHYVQHSVCTMEEVPPEVAEMHRRHDALWRQGLPWLVALDGTEVIGYAYASRYRARVGYAGTLESSIYLDAAYQGRGVGRALLEALVAAGAAFGARQMVAVIVDGADTRGSIRLHARLGFQQVGVLARVGRKFGRDVDTILMQRSLQTP